MIDSDGNTYALAVEQIEAAIQKADGMIGYFPRNQLYLALGMVEMAAALFPEHARELAKTSGDICRKMQSLQTILGHQRLQAHSPGRLHMPPLLRPAQKTATSEAATSTSGSDK